jgi:hypothetical protein
MIKNNSVIIDVQIANDMKVLNWDAKQAQVVCISAIVVVENKRVQTISLPSYNELDEFQYKQVVMQTFVNLLQQGYRFYALNCEFIQQLFRHLFDLEIVVLDIRQGMKGKGSGKDDLYRILCDKIDCDHYDDFFDFDCYKEHQYENSMLEIVDYSIKNVNKCFHIFSNIEYLKAQFELNKDGFIIKRKGE